jgi:membrane protein
MKELIEIIRAVVTRWEADECRRLGAALAFYAVFSIAPLVLLAVVVAGLVIAPIHRIGHPARDRRATRR